MPTILCFEAHKADGLVWSVRHKGQWMSAKRVTVNVPAITVYRGPKARQPKAYVECLTCKSVTGDSERLVIS